MFQARKAKTARTKRVLENRDPKVVENNKVALFVRGSTTSQVVNDALGDLYMLKKPEAVKFSKKNEIHPFEDTASVEFFSQKNDASLMLLGNHSKKRPHNLTFIRMFNYSVMDMIEVGVENAKTMSDFKNSKCALGMKPCFLFNGEIFEQVEEYIKFKNLLVDFYQGQIVDKIDLTGLEHVITVTADPTSKSDKPVMYFRVYIIKLKKSGTRLPRVELEEMGPSLDFTIRRTQFPSYDVLKEATRVPRELQPKKVKNIKHDDMGDKMGRVHMTKQDLGTLQTRKMKGLKASVPIPTAEEPTADDADDVSE